MSFLRHEEIYRSDVAKRLGGNDLCGLPALIGCDEFPAGYSLVGCSPAEPASASPAANDSPQGQAPRKNFSSNGNYPLNSVSHDKGSLQFAAAPPSPPLENLSPPIKCPRLPFSHPA